MVKGFAGVTLAWAAAVYTAFTPLYALADDKPEVPPSAPFTPRSTDQALAPPAPMPDLNLPPEPEPAGIEERFRLMQAKQTVSTASKREQSLADVPLTLSAIPAEELEGTGQFTLCDAIQYFPGL